jgi:hypothetical protein
MRHSLYILLLLFSTTGTALASTVPQEPEDDNQEYLLDIVTHQYSRWWREVWDGGDNRFRFRLGSNKVTQWFLEEELKLAAPLFDRVRFRFHHARLFRYTTEEIAWDVLEFEGRVHDQMYLSFYARPTFDKREGAIGLMAQHRRAVDRYAILSIEWPGFMRNYFEHRRETSDSLLNVFTNRPVRLSLRLREQLLSRLWVGAFGELVPSFEMGDEVTATGQQFPREEADARALTGWVEYTLDPAKPVRDQTSFGIEAGYERSAKTKDVDCGCVPLFLLRPTGPSTRRGEELWAVPQGHFGEDLYERTDEDTVRAWHDRRAFVSPYAWIPIGERVVLNATLRYEEREIRVRSDAGLTDETTNEYVVPRIGASYAMGSRRQYILEGGFVSEFRKRTVERAAAGSSLVSVREEDFDDHRLYLAFEYVFGESNLVRLIEGFELDGEDRGQFGIHDHGFFQLIIGF